MDIVKNLLENSNFEYELIFHEKQLYSAKDGAAYFGIEVGQTAPTLVITSEKGYFSLVFSGERRKIDFVGLAQSLQVAQVTLVNKDKIIKITGFMPGDTPMVGLVLPSILDKKLLQYPFVYGGSGQANRTLKISPLALIELNQPVAFLEDD